MSWPATFPDIGPSIPAWWLNAAGFLLAFGLSAPQWDNTVMIVLPVFLYLGSALRSTTVLNFLSLGMVLLALAVGQVGIGLLLFPLAAGVHLLFLIYGATARLQLDSWVSLQSLKLLARRFVLAEISVQLLATLAFFTKVGGTSLPIAVAGCAAAAGLALVWVRAKRG